MDVVITARHGHLSKNEESWIREKLNRLSRFCQGERPARVVVEHALDRSKVEVNMGAPRGVQLNAHGEASSLRKAVQMAENRLETQLRKNKERLRNHRG